MAYAAAHDEEMENLVGAEARMQSVEDRELQSVDDAADGVDNAARQEPAEGGWGQGVYDLSKGQHAGPAHADIEGGGEPFRAGDPESFHNNAHQGDGPYQGTQQIPGAVVEYHQADRRIGTRDQYEDHHVIDLAQDTVCALGQIQGMIGRAGCIEQDHAGHKDGERDQMNVVRLSGGFDQQRRGGKDGHQHANKMCDGAAGIF